jgi:ABC-type transporter Mla maintaining outer membrane lipid asymmetry ATPase subunit MlaF
MVEVEAVELAGGDGAPPVSFRLGRGELLALEGAGEATGAELLRALVGLVRPSAGRVRVLGGDPAGLTRAGHEALLARVGYLPRYGALLSNITLEANLLLPLAYHRALPPDEAARTGRAAAARFGVAWPLPDALPAAVSPSLRRRVALARAVVLEPELLLLDDFTDDLSRVEGAAVASAVRAYAAERGAAVLAATDDPNLGARLGARRQTLED